MKQFTSFKKNQESINTCTQFKTSYVKDVDNSIGIKFFIQKTILSVNVLTNSLQCGLKLKT